MHTPRQDLIRMLEVELDLIEKGGYSQTVREPWKEQPIFEGSLVCINHWLVTDHPPDVCRGCALLEFVPPQFRNKPSACKYIQLTDSGETVESLKEKGDPEELLLQIEEWLRSTVRELKEEEDFVAKRGPIDY